MATSRSPRPSGVRDQLFGVCLAVVCRLSGLISCRPLLVIRSYSFTSWRIRVLSMATDGSLSAYRIGGSACLYRLKHGSDLPGDHSPACLRRGRVTKKVLLADRSRRWRRVHPHHSRRPRGSGQQHDLRQGSECGHAASYRKRRMANIGSSLHRSGMRRMGRR